MKKVLFISTLILLLLSASIAHAANCTVNKAVDTSDGSCTGADCSLRDAVADANCTTIDFALSLVDHPLVLSGGEILINRNVTISGFAPDAISISGGGTSRIFYISTIGNLNISGVTLTGGNGTGFDGEGGGAVRSRGALFMNNVVVSGNTSEFGGGVLLISTNAPSHIRNSLFTGNTTTGGFSAALAADDVPGETTIYNSTFAFNNGTALFLFRSTFRMVNSTVAFNTRGARIGGMSMLQPGNSILRDVCVCQTFSTLFSSGNNIINQTSDSFPVDYHSTDQVNVAPLLGPLARNGGPTATLGLLPGSPAIDNGNILLSVNAGLSTDQRGFGRFADGNGDTFVTVDIGAYEHLSLPPQPSGLVTVAGRVFDTGNRPLSNVNVILNDTNGNYRFAYTSSLGWFVFENVPKEMVYRLNISSKRHNAPQRVIFPSADAFDADIIATALGAAPRGK